MKETLYKYYYELSQKSAGREIDKEVPQEKEAAGEWQEVIMSCREVGRKAHEETKQSYMKEYGKYMEPEQISRLESEETLEKLHVVTAEEYINQFPNVDFNVLGHCDKEGNIYVKAISDDYVLHTITHETTHLSADREIYEDDNGVTNIVSGFRETLRDGKIKLADHNVGINEGVTELYTLRELERRGETEATNCVKSYSEARIWGAHLEALLGREIVSAAYFGKNKETMVQEFNRLNNGDENAWKEFAADIDIVSFDDDPMKIDEARKRLQEKYKTMYLNKYLLSKEGRE